MNSRHLPGARLLAAFLLCLAALAHSAPTPDTTFGTNGRARIGSPKGFEDTPYTSAIQSDGKVIVAGTSIGRQTYAFVTRFRSDGVPDPAFGAGGAALVAPPAGYFWMIPAQVEPLADGAVLMVALVFNGFAIARIGPDGTLDAGFGAGGIVIVADSEFSSNSGGMAGIRLAVQPDGKLLVVTGKAVLRFRRFLAHGELDATYGANGERVVGGVPPNFAFTDTRLAVTDPAGGFTLVLRATFDGGTWLLLRAGADAALDPNLGGVGYVSGFDLGNPLDLPRSLTRLASNRYALFGLRPTVDPTIYEVAWEVDAGGKLVTAFGYNGYLLFSNSTGSPRYVNALPDDGIATAQFFGNGTVQISRFGPLGNPVAQFGTGLGNAMVIVPGYQQFQPVGIHADAQGRITVAGWAYLRWISVNFITTTYSGSDAVLVSVDPSGVPRTDFGRGDGIAVWNNPDYSNDRIDALQFDASGRILLAGFSNGSGAYDYLLSRLNPDGTPDAGYGTGGRLYPQQYARFTGIARAVQQPDGAMIVAGGDAFGSVGNFATVTAFRASTNGVVDAAFKPALASAGPNATVALGVRPDARLLYGSGGFGLSAALQQLQPDGTPDPGFGVGGKVTLPLDAGESSRQADLVLLDDDSAVLAVFTTTHVRLYKVDARGAPVLAFGTGGQLAYPTPGLPPSIASGARLLALADGTLFAAYGSVASAPLVPVPHSALFVLRTTVDGTVLAARTLLAEDAFLYWALADLDDASVVIARGRNDGTTRSAALYRLLPDDQFDTSFGAGGAYPLPGITAVNALAIDIDGRLLVSAQDASSAVLARFRLDAPVAGVAVVEYFNTDLRHYFMTANAAEMASIESGGAGPGWQRTGYGFSAFVPEAGVPIGARPVCRFYGTPGIGPNSHFYTADAGECAAVKRDPGWSYEGTAFYAFVPDHEQCAAGERPVYRAYNNGYVRNDSNHRYALELPLLEGLKPQGWTIEGAVFCTGSNSSINSQNPP